MKLLFLLLFSSAAFGQDSANKLTFTSHSSIAGSAIHFPEHPTYKVLDSNLTEIISYRQGSDTVLINPDKIHYVTFDGVIYQITSAGILQGKPWYMISPKLKSGSNK